MANYCNIDQYLYNYLKGCWVDKKFHGVFPSRTSIQTSYNNNIEYTILEMTNINQKKNSSFAIYKPEKTNV